MDDENELLNIEEEINKNEIKKIFGTYINGFIPDKNPFKTININDIEDDEIPLIQLKKRV